MPAIDCLSPESDSIMRLHVLNQSRNLTLIEQCLDNLDSTDTLLLIEDAVYLLMQQQFSAKARVIALSDDALARNINTKVPLINYQQWVELTEQASSLIHWY